MMAKMTIPVILKMRKTDVPHHAILHAVYSKQALFIKKTCIKLHRFITKVKLKDKLTNKPAQRPLNLPKNPFIHYQNPSLKTQYRAAAALRSTHRCSGRLLTTPTHRVRC